MSFGKTDHMVGSRIYDPKYGKRVISKIIPYSRPQKNISHLRKKGQINGKSSAQKCRLGRDIWVFLEHRRIKLHGNLLCHLCRHRIDGFPMEFPGELRMAINKMTGIWELVFMMFWFFGHRSFQVPIIPVFSTHEKSNQTAVTVPVDMDLRIMRARHLMSQFSWQS